ncbi:MAG: DUF1559 domain-containing protein [Planctomycetaceae bacterium]|jgi:prepilin-type N-terminal cleavage/methylation domain-containing protein/prepilin-type processing-associated H-X9-DG protein|nr:DUF1559 domain-containing protein [Planctomycetaceae bacterium]
MMQKFFKPSGFTLVELLITVAVVGVLIGLLLPAIQVAREDVRQMQCTENMKQLMTATQKYYEAKEEFPYYTGLHRTASSKKGTNSSNMGYSVQAAVLPYIGNADLFATFADAYNEPTTKLWMWLGFIEESSRPAAQTDIAVFRCPGDDSALKASSVLTTKNGRCGMGMDSPVASGNYMACNGSGTGYNYDHTVVNDGVVGKKNARTLKMFTKGAANTLFFSEAIIGDTSRYNNTPAELTTPWIRTATVKSENITYRGEVNWTSDVPGIEGVFADDDFDIPTFVTANVDNWYGLRGFSWIIGDSYSTGFTTFSVPNPKHPDWCDEMGIGFFAARSFHSGGVNVVRADGSASFVSNSVDRKVWQKMGVMK